ncbi:MAG: ABC transporter permease [Candidatus Moranbacteria bacterium]|nr:ABC transporter permease [Candidatus Moranbacteria bacterium]
MTARDILKLSTRMFTARRGRTILTVLGMGIGFGAILFLVSLGYGLQDALLETITASGALTSLDVSPNEQDAIFLTGQAIDEMKKIEGVSGVETSFNFNSRMSLGDTSLDSRAEVATLGYLNLEGLKVFSGEMLGKSSSKEILVTAAIGKTLGKNPEELAGQKISFTLLSPAGKGSSNIDEPDFAIAGVVEGEDTIFYVLPDNLNLPGGLQYAKAKVGCRSSEVMDSVKEKISGIGFTVSSLSETVAEVNKLFRVVNIILGLFGIITLAVSAIGMFNTMTVTLLERTNEIGIMRSIGASKTDILSLFVIESTLMGLCGGLAGLFFGFLSGQAVNIIVNLAAKYFGGKPMDLFAYPLWFLGFILLFSIVIGFATGIGPAKRASSLDPLEALSSR